MRPSPEELLDRAETALEADAPDRAEALLAEFAASPARSVGGLVGRAAWIGAVVALHRGAPSDFLDQSERALAALRRAGADDLARSVGALRAELQYGVAAEAMVVRHGLAGFLEVCRHDCRLLIELEAGDPGDPRWAAINRWRRAVLPALLRRLAEVTGAPPPIAAAARAFRLDPIEAVVLLIATTLALHPSLRGPRADGGLAAERLARLGFADPVMVQAALHRMQPGAPLVTSRLLDVVSEQPLTVAPDRGVTGFFRGQFAPPRGPLGVTVMTATVPELVPSRRAALTSATRALQASPPRVVLLAGAEGSGRSVVARAAAAALEAPLLAVEATGAIDRAAIERLERDARLRGALILIRDDAVDLASRLSPAAQLLVRCRPARAGELSAALSMAGRPVSRVSLEPLPGDEQPAVWGSLLREAGAPMPADDALAALARDRLGPGDLRAALALAPAQPSAADLACALDAHLESALHRVAEELSPAPVNDPALDRIVAEIAALPAGSCARLTGSDAQSAAIARAVAAHHGVPCARVDLDLTAADPARLEVAFEAAGRCGAVLCLARTGALARAGAAVVERLGRELERTAARVIVGGAGDGPLPIAIESRLAATFAPG